jgi:hypothetical protein
MRMNRRAVCAALGKKQRWLYDRVAAGRFPPMDSDDCWDRATVQHYAEGGIKNFDRHRARIERRA